MINFVLNDKKLNGLFAGALILTEGDKIEFMSIVTGSSMQYLEDALFKRLLEKIENDIGWLGKGIVEKEYMRAIDNVNRVDWVLRNGW